MRTTSGSCSRAAGAPRRRSRDPDDDHGRRARARPDRVGRDDPDLVSVARSDLRDSAGHMGAPDGGQSRRDPAERDSPHARRARRARAREPRRRAADLRPDALDARPDLPLAVRRRFQLSVRLQCAREWTDDHPRRTVPRHAVGAHRVARARALGPDGAMNSARRALPALTAIALLIAAWWIAVVASGSVIFPTPWQVVLGAVALIADGTLWAHIGASLFRVIAGFALAVALGVPLGIWMGWVAGAFQTLNPIVQMLRPISPIAWIPIAILWFGVGNASPIYLIFISSVFPLIVQTTVGVHTIERRYLWAAENFAVSRFALFRGAVIPAALPQVIVGMRIGLGVAWLVVVAAEMIALRSGLGYLIIDSRNAGNRYDLVIAGMILIGVIGLLLDGMMRRLERLEAVRWRYAPKA